MQLSARQCAMLTIIMDSDGYVTMDSIARQLSLSKRTILREFDRLCLMLNKSNFVLESKSGYGIRFCGGHDARQQIEVLLNQSSKQTKDLSPTGRETYLLTQLLQQQHPIKIYTFTRELNVTEATIGSDLNRCERWLKDIGIELVRKPGVGIYIEAEEWSRRRALIRLFHQEIGDIPFNEEFYNSPAVSQLFNRQKLDEIRHLIDSTPDVRDVFLSDRSYSAIVVHLYFILQRVQAGAAITNPRLAEAIEEDEEETKLANRLLELLQSRFEIIIPAPELGYLVTILRSAQGLKKFDDRHREQQARRIADKLIRIAENHTGILIGTENAFYDALLRHLIPTISRLNLHMEIRNPMLDDIKKHYAPLYELAKLGVSAMEEELGVPVPDSEIGYIAIHLGVALEDRKMHLQRRYKAVICCPSGVISAKLLALRVEREFSDIAIVDVVSTLSLDYDEMKLDGIELVISTVTLRDCPLPSAVVSPFLLDEEKDQLRRVLKNCKRGVHAKSPPFGPADVAGLLHNSQLLINSILELLDGFFYLDGNSLTSPIELVEMAAETVGESDLAQAAIARSLFEREDYGSTVTMDGRCMLLHCRTAGVSKLHLGVIHLGGAIRLDSNQTPSAALVMLAPVSCPRQALDVLSVVGCSTVESPWFLDAVCSGNKAACYKAIEQVLAAYYNNTVKLQ